MKKLLTAMFGFALICFSAEAVERKIGFTASFSDFESTGTETLKSSSNKTSTEVEESVIVPSIFFEIGNDAGLALGIDIIPGDADLGSKSKTKTDTDTDDASDTSGTNTASANVDSHNTIYLKIPVKAAFIKLGYVEADVITTENLATGTTYGNVTVNGTQVAVGFDKDVPNGAFVRLEASYTDYEDFSITGSADTDSVTNKVDADIDSTALRISIGKAF